MADITIDSLTRNFERERRPCFYCGRVTGGMPFGGNGDTRWAWVCATKQCIEEWMPMRDAIDAFGRE